MCVFVMAARLLRAAFVAFVILCCVSVSSPAQKTGTIKGRVTDRDTGKPITYANVMVFGTQMGAMALGDGSYRIPGVPAGKYTVRLLMVGYKNVELRNVVVDAGGETEVNLVASREIAMQTEAITVIGQRVPISSVKDSDWKQGMDEVKISQIAADDFRDVVGIMTGVVRMGDELHVRGKRQDGNSVRIDDVPVDDPLTGGQLEVSLFGTQNVEMLSGGMDAEYGDAQAAIINIVTKEGSRNFGGELRYWTDDFGRQDKTYTNYDRLSIGVGGPTWVDRLTYYVAGEITLTDGENRTIEPRQEHKITDWLKYRDRLQQSFNLQSKLAWTHGRVKMTAETIMARSKRESYMHNWNISGYVSKTYYLQRLQKIRPSQPGSYDVYAFAGVAQMPHGRWATDPAAVTPVPIIVEELVRDPETGEQEVRVHDRFRAVIIGAATYLWDEVTAGSPAAPAATRSWILFEGFQAPFSRFSHFQEDSSYVWFNSAARAPETTTDQLHTKLSLAHNITSKLLYTIKLSRLELNTKQTVNDQAPAQFSTAGLPVTLPNGAYLPGGLTNATHYTDTDHPYFATAYDFPFFADLRTVQYLIKADLISEQLKGHRIKTGVQMVYNDLHSDERVNPGQQRFDRVAGTVQQGINVNLFRNYNTEGAVYVQDKWEFEGLVANAGVRLDFFSTGNNDEILIHSSEIEQTVDKYKANISPRVGFAFPITDRDKFHFHYGRFTQWPSRTYLFATQDPVGSLGILGNPNLEPELTISYQAGITHQFSDDILGNFIVFSNDIYGLVSSAPVTDDSTALLVQRYVNRTYASSRGLEVSMEKRLSHNIGFDLAYTYAFADGVASDADFGRSAEGLTHLPTDELPLAWDQRHTFALNVRIAQGNSWLVSGGYVYGSGMPWTPVDRFARLADPTWENSRRLEPTHQLNMRGQKLFNVYGHRFTLYVEGRNLMDDDILLRNGTRPTANPGLEFAGMDGGSYLTETGRYGGAYLRDTDDDGVNDFVPVNDPTIWQPHRVWRMGFGVRF